VSPSTGHWRGRRSERRRRRTGIVEHASPAPARRLAVAALVVAAGAWLLVGTGSDARQVSREFAFTGSRATFVVPPDVCRLHVDAAGASGGLQGAAGTPGLGARVEAAIRVVPGETLEVRVGGQGGTALGSSPARGGWNGGGDGGAASRRADGREGRAGSGGGGATDVRRGRGTLENRILVAGGGAGSGGAGIVGTYGISGGEGGALSGGDGFAPLGTVNPTTGGHGGTQIAGGGPGRDGSDGASTATGGSAGVGGNGASGGVNGGGGGGGGFFGGGGGGTEAQWTTTPLGAGQGGGGSSFGPRGTSFRTGVWGNLGEGSMRIAYDLDADECAAPSAHGEGSP
jgi:glycine rich protein